MIKTSTHTLIRYAYNETLLKETVEAQNAIDGDPLIAGEYNEIIESLKELDKFKMDPSDKTIKNILEKARSVIR